MCLKCFESTLSTFFEMLGECFEAIFSHKQREKDRIGNSPDNQNLKKLNLFLTEHVIPNYNEDNNWLLGNCG